MKGIFQKWKEKKLIDKIGDIAFLIFVIALIIPSSRMALTVTLKRLFLFSPKAISSEERITVEQSEFYWPMETLDGRETNLELLRGKTLFINLWATWCPPCVAEMPSIQKLYDQLKDDENVAFVIVTNEDRETVKQFMNEAGYDFPVMLSRSNPPEQFYSRSIPTTFLVSPEGEIVLREVGSKKWHGAETVELISSLRRQP